MRAWQMDGRVQRSTKRAVRAHHVQSPPQHAKGREFYIKELKKKKKKRKKGSGSIKDKKKKKKNKSNGEQL